ncbi:MAG: pseudouridine synthase [Candidatus Kapabacteria bacterium]|nr:pseudouridine synthase [Candidatus Kapabacteria bacterium]
MQIVSCVKSNTCITQYLHHHSRRDDATHTMNQRKPSRPSSARRDERSSSSRTSDRRSYDKPSGERRSYDKPSGERRPYDKPSGERRSYDKPSGERRSYDKPSGERRSYDKPSGERRSYDKPSGERRSYDKPSGERRSYDKPSGERRSYDKPYRERRTDDRPFRERRTDDKPSMERRETGQTRTELPPDQQRLNKAIADAGVASRRHADEMIAAGRVRINGEIVTELGSRVGIDDMVTVDGEPITRTKHLTYVILNKPKDIITTASDEKGRSTVFDIVRIHTRLFTIGRLDRNTTGLLLLTNDGELAHRLMHPSYEVPRVYRARLDKPLKPVDAKQIAAGVELEDGMTSPCEVMIDPRDSHVAHIALHEGRNREVRRLFEALGYDVKSLDRKQYAFLTIRGMQRGEYRHLTRDEVNELRKLVRLS